jgi:excisionase family DNA binding protein
MINWELRTVKELAEALKVKPSWIYGQTRKKGQGSMPKIRVGKYLRFSLEDVLEWLRKRQSET